MVSNVMVYKTRREDQEAFYAGGRKTPFDWLMANGSWRTARSCSTAPCEEV